MRSLEELDCLFRSSGARSAPRVGHVAHPLAALRREDGGRHPGPASGGGRALGRRHGGRPRAGRRRHRSLAVPGVWGRHRRHRRRGPREGRLPAAVRGAVDHPGHRRSWPRPIAVPETRDLESLLADLRAAAAHLAIVVDEYGGTAGIITSRTCWRRSSARSTTSTTRDTVPVDGGAPPGRGCCPGTLHPDEVPSDRVRDAGGRVRDAGRLRARPAGPHPERRREGRASTAGPSRCRRWTAGASTASGWSSRARAGRRRPSRPPRGQP